MNLPNKKRGEVAIPEAGDGVYARFTVEALEKLEGKYGDEYITVIIKGLHKGSVPTFRACLSAAVHPEEARAEIVARFPWDAPLETIQAYLLDALTLSVNGRTFEEQRKHEDELFEKNLHEASKNPRAAASLLSWIESTSSGIGQASDPTKSAATPH